MKKDFKKFYNESEQLNESGLAKLTGYMDEHDCGIISASRDYIKDGRKMNPEQNRKRTKVLQMQLMDLGYDIIPVKGSFIENFGGDPNDPDPKKRPHQVRELSYFVVDSKDRGRLLRDLMKLGEEWYQDGISFIKKGENSLTIYGTNDTYRDTAKQYPVREIGKERVFMTKVHGRPFNFDESYNFKTIQLPEGMGRQLCNSLSKQNWETFSLSKEDLKELGA